MANLSLCERGRGSNKFYFNLELDHILRNEVTKHSHGKSVATSVGAPNLYFCGATMATSCEKIWKKKYKTFFQCIAEHNFSFRDEIENSFLTKKSKIKIHFFWFLDLGNMLLMTFLSAFNFMVKFRKRFLMQLDLQFLSPRIITYKAFSVQWNPTTQEKEKKKKKERNPTTEFEPFKVSKMAHSWVHRPGVY